MKNTLFDEKINGTVHLASAAASPISAVRTRARSTGTSSRTCAAGTDRARRDGRPGERPLETRACALKYPELREGDRDRLRPRRLVHRAAAAQRGLGSHGGRREGGRARASRRGLAGRIRARARHGRRRAPRRRHRGGRRGRRLHRRRQHEHRHRPGRAEALRQSSASSCGSSTRRAPSSTGSAAFASSARPRPRSRSSTTPSAPARSRNRRRWADVHPDRRRRQGRREPRATCSARQPRGHPDRAARRPVRRAGGGVRARRPPRRRDRAASSSSAPASSALRTSCSP